MTLMLGFLIKIEFQVLAQIIIHGIRATSEICIMYRM